ncbi:MAG: response regulator [Verrucomicrobia bacterium]|nr:response regulator [Verrucomicrobiota bacterium]
MTVDDAKILAVGKNGLIEQALNVLFKDQEERRVDMVENASAAAETAPTNHYDVVVLDTSGDDPAGTGLISRLSSSEFPYPPQTIILTDDPQRLCTAVNCGIRNVLSKSISADELAARIESAANDGAHLNNLQSEYRHLTSQLETAQLKNREKTDFLATMSYQIRTAMNGVIAIVDPLMESNLPPNLEELVENVRTSGNALMHIMNEILDISKIETGELQLNIHTFSLRKCIEDSLELFAPKASGKDIELFYIWSDGTLEFVKGDEARLRQILINLISNGIKFTHEGEVYITVDMSREPPPPEAGTEEPAAGEDNHNCMMQISVSDSGIGIPEDKLPRLFKAFSQTDPSVTRRYGGTGLGLAISSSLLNLMGGTMGVESVPNQGSSFHFTLPTIAVAGSPEKLTLPEPEKGNKAVICHPNPKFLQGLSSQLNRLQLQTVSTTSIEEADGLLKKDPSIRLLLLDETLISEQTLSFEQLKSHIAATNKAAILLTNIGTQARAHDIKTPKRFITLHKPVKTDRLRITLASLFQEQKTSEEKPSQRRLDHSLAQRFPMKLLLVDDNNINVKVVLSLLRQFGYQAESVSRGMDAIEAFSEKKHDLIFMDVQMPEMDGLEATRRIRAKEEEMNAASDAKHKSIIIALTAKTMTGDKEKCFEAGMNDFLAKPLRPEILQSTIQKWGEVIAQDQSTKQPARESEKPEKPAAFPPTQETITDTSESQEDYSPEIDKERLIEFAGGSPDMMKELLDLYIEQTSEKFTQLRKAIDQQNAEEIRRIAHSSAGANATCGINGIADLLYEIEDHGKNGRVEQAAKVFTMAEKKFEFLEKNRESLLETP